MNRFSKLALSGTVALSLAAGLAYAQQSNDAPPLPPAAQQDGAGPDGAGPDGAGPDMARNGGCDDMAGGMRGHHGMRGDQQAMRGDGMRGHRGMDRGMGPGMGRQMIDSNSDGVINDDEAASIFDRQFNRLDQDRDGNVSEAEFTSPPRAPGWRAWFSGAEADAVLKVRKDAFAALDADKNGSVNKAEFFADAKAKLAAADTDKDGKINPWEFRTLPRM